MTIGENIRRIRKEKGITQKELGERLNMTQSAIGQFENNKTSPKKDTIEKIASALSVKPSELMKGVWETLDKKHSDEIENTVKHLEFIDFLKSSGYSYDYQVTKWHYGEVIDEPNIREKIVDESETTLSKDGHKATFTEKEFEELQAGAKEAIEGKFFKKVLEQQKKK